MGLPPKPDKPALALKPCPFCGGEADFEEIVNKDDKRVCTWSVGCGNEDCAGYLLMAVYPRKADAAAAWNRRMYTMDANDIGNRFTYHKPFGTQQERYVAIRDTAKSLALLINDSAPESREKSLAMTKLEESVMWANASIARNEKE